MMTKDEYVKTLKKYMADNELDQEDGFTYLDGIQEAAALARQLDEPKKVVIPEIIANDIKYHKKHGSTLRGALGSAFDQDAESNVYYWFFAADGDENVRKYISAWDNGYEVEKEPELHVKLKGLVTGAAYLNYNVPFQTFSTNSLSSPEHMNTNFTKSWLAKNWPEYEAYNNAGLLEFEEVEDEAR
ncbi:DUF1642 domain-containing protein [Pediococcus pentosaceus]|uniref:DUF1642 domain-containing protein n=1 Tax=Pediococcus pentosaceus TaxID=1255 RepID=UPI0018A13B7F|nr:DUF1642 domain-containing protein [Pediococcus pentosaceus]MBF7103429.1 DUF1642 domain-containing protein [Pediococcus pentosaceus]